VFFSESEDQLSQWRGYAQNGKGLAIGFDKRILEELNLINEYNIAFGKVIYNDTEAYVQDIVQDNIEKFQCKSLVHVALELCQDYRLKFPFMKKPGFEEKKEWRGIVCSRIGNSLFRTNTVFKNQIYHIDRKCCDKNGNIYLKVKIKVSEIW